MSDKQPDELHGIERHHCKDGFNTVMLKSDDTDAHYLISLKRDEANEEDEGITKRHSIQIVISKRESNKRARINKFVDVLINPVWYAQRL